MNPMDKQSGRGRGRGRGRGGRGRGARGPRGGRGRGYGRRGRRDSADSDPDFVYRGPTKSNPKVELHYVRQMSEYFVKFFTIFSTKYRLQWSRYIYSCNITSNHLNYSHSTNIKTIEIIWFGTGAHCQIGSKHRHRRVELSESTN